MEKRILERQVMGQAKTKSKDMLEQALETPCPFCGGINLVKNWWSLNDGEALGIECNDCLAGAPMESWLKRSNAKFTK